MPHVVELCPSPVFHQVVETGEDLCGKPLNEVRRLSSIHNINVSYMTDITLDRCSHGITPPLVAVITRGKSSCGPELPRGSGHSE